MEVHVTVRLWLAGLVLLLLASTAGWTVMLYVRACGGPCEECSGRGDVWKDDQWLECVRCEGTGGMYSKADYGSLMISRILALRRELGFQLQESRSPILMVTVCLLSLGAIIASMRMVDCRLCRTTGLLRVPYHVRRRGATFVQGACVDCGGRGQLTLIDRWLS